MPKTCPKVRSTSAAGRSRPTAAAPGSTTARPAGSRGVLVVCCAQTASTAASSEVNSIDRLPIRKRSKRSPLPHASHATYDPRIRTIPRRSAAGVGNGRIRLGLCHVLIVLMQSARRKLITTRRSLPGAGGVGERHASPLPG